MAPSTWATLSCFSRPSVVSEVGHPGGASGQEDGKKKVKKQPEEMGKKIRLSNSKVSNKKLKEKSE